MKLAIFIILSLVVSFQPSYGDAQTEFETRAVQLSSLIKRINSEVIITRTETSFKAEFDTMTYTVHSGSKTGNYAKQPHQEVGPQAKGFIIKIFVHPVAPSAALLNSGTGQAPYWQEYWWKGCHDAEKYVHFDFKFGGLVDQQFKNEIIKIVTKPNQQVDPIVKPPVDKVEAQSTQGHP